MDRIKVKDNQDLERDLSSNAIINTNKNAYEMQRKDKQTLKEQEMN